VKKLFLKAAVVRDDGHFLCGRPELRRRPSSAFNSRHCDPYPKGNRVNARTGAHRDCFGNENFGALHFGSARMFYVLPSAVGSPIRRPLILNSVVAQLCATSGD
jgi:hypothetical protein